MNVRCALNTVMTITVVVNGYMLAIGLTKLTGPFSNPFVKKVPANEKKRPANIAYVIAVRS